MGPQNWILFHGNPNSFFDQRSYFLPVTENERETQKNGIINHNYLTHYTWQFVYKNNAISKKVCICQSSTGTERVLSILKHPNQTINCFLNPKRYTVDTKVFIIEVKSEKAQTQFIALFYFEMCDRMLFSYIDVLDTGVFVTLQTNASLWILLDHINVLLGLFYFGVDVDM